MRQAIEKIPDGSYAATGHMDGYIDDPRPKPGATCPFV